MCFIFISQISVAANPDIKADGPSINLFIICFGRGFQYHFLDFAVEEEES